MTLVMVIYNSKDHPMNPGAKSLWMELAKTTYRDRQCKGIPVYIPYGSNQKCYCIMGLLCVAYAIAHGLDPDEFTTMQNIRDHVSRIIKWAGLNSPDGMYKLPNGFTTTLVHKNDSGVPFPELANIIQENF